MQQTKNKCGPRIPAFLCPEPGTHFRQGDFYMRPLDPETDIPLVHAWVNREAAVYWQLLGSTPQQVKELYVALCDTPYTQPFIGYYQHEPVFLAEFYHAQGDRIGAYYEVEAGDYGFHILMAPAITPIHNFTFQVFTVIMDFLFSDPRVTRLIVEPDAGNEKIHVLNKRAGFEYRQVIELPEKTARLAFCDRTQYTAALEKVAISI